MRRLLPLVLLVAAVATAPAASAGDPVLDQPRHGADAVRALGERINAVARANDTTAAELREELQSDLSLWVDVQGRLFFVDPPAPADVGATEAGTATTTAPQTEAEVLSLQSKPGSSRTIHLDVDGHDDIGEAWADGYTGGDGVAEPYDRDGNPGTLGTGELAEIYSIWQRVAEDFAPFDVNVTTQDPGFDAIDRSESADGVFGTRVVLTSSATDCACGGVAYVGVYDHYGTTYPHSYYQPAFVYNEGAKAAAEAASHEAGHNLGLSHDGTRQTGYYQGHGAWAPIMGVGYYQPISQWSRGEYSGANNKEDDFSVAGANGALLRTDDHATGRQATQLSSTQTGVITTAADVDEFAFSIGQEGSLTVTVAPAEVSPDLDARLTLRRVDGTVLELNDPTSAFIDKDLASGLGATIEVPALPAGSYVVSIDGVGAGDPLSTGYSDYGSVGAYTLTASSATFGAPVWPAVVTLGAPTNLSATVAGTTVNLGWTAGANATSYELQRAKQLKGGTWSSWSALPPTTSTSYADVPGTGTFRYQVRSVDGEQRSAWTDPATATLTKTSGKPQR